jgi:DNA-binding CsgD family transcriptional regulator
MKEPLNQFFNRLDTKVNAVRRMTKSFCDSMYLTAFAYVRVYHDGRVGWVTSNADQDRLLTEFGFFRDDPLIDTAQALKQGHYLWFHDRKFPKSDEFYEQRSRHFKIDHGMVLVSHQKDYLETGCFSGLIAQKPLYNVFSQEQGLFKSYLEYFKQNLPRSMLPLLEDGIHLRDLKPTYGKDSSLAIPKDRKQLIVDCGWKNLLAISKGEMSCLSFLRDGLTYEAIAEQLKLSPRTVESYLHSVKNKLNLKTRTDLCQLANRLSELGLLKKRSR